MGADWCVGKKIGRDDYTANVMASWSEK